VVLPILAPAILAAGAFLLIATFVVFDVPGALGMPVRIFVLSTQIFFWYDLSTTGLPQYGNIAALATLFLAILALLGFSYQRMTRSAQRFVTITGKGFRVRRFPLGQWRPFALAGVVGYVICAVGAPLLLLLWTSLMPYETPVTLSAFHLITPANYLALISNVRFLEALRNSLVIAIVSASAVAALSAAVAWVVVRTHAIGRNIVDILAFAPIAVPGVMIGMALVVVYLTFHAVHVYGTIWIIAIAYVTTYLSYGSRAMRAAMLQIHPELEEAAQTSGARWLTVFRRITFPLTSTAFIAVWVWVLAHSMRELSSALMLHGESNTVLTTLLWDYWSGGEPTKAATVGVWLIVALFIAIYTWQKRETARS
ncbi:MAG: ABC transporter permease, partial [Candidatus Dormibacteria bacterium]